MSLGLGLRFKFLLTPSPRRKSLGRFVNRLDKTGCLWFPEKQERGLRPTRAPPHGAAARRSPSAAQPLSWKLSLRGESYALRLAAQTDCSERESAFNCIV